MPQMYGYSNFFNPVNCNETSAIYRGASIITRRQTLRGSLTSRHNHSKPRLQTRLGARDTVPLRNLSDAPAPTTTGTSRAVLWSDIHCSCFGMPRPTHSTSGLVSLIEATIAASSSGVHSRKGGELTPPIVMPGNAEVRLKDNRSSVCSVSPRKKYVYPLSLAISLNLHRRSGPVSCLLSR